MYYDCHNEMGLIYDSGVRDTPSGVRTARIQTQSADSPAANKGAMRYWILYNRTIHTSASSGGSETAHAGAVNSAMVIGVKGLILHCPMLCRRVVGVWFAGTPESPLSC